MKLSPSVSLYIRIRSGNGSWIYASPAQTSKGHLRPLQAMIAGQPTYCADGGEQHVQWVWGDNSMPVTTIIVIFDSPVHGPLVSPAVGYL